MRKGHDIATSLNKTEVPICCTLLTVSHYKNILIKD